MLRDFVDGNFIDPILIHKCYINILYSNKPLFGLGMVLTTFGLRLADLMPPVSCDMIPLIAMELERKRVTKMMLLFPLIN